MTNTKTNYKVLSQLNDEFVQNLKLVSVFGDGNKTLLLTKDYKLILLEDECESDASLGHTNQKEVNEIGVQLCDQIIVDFAYGLNHLIAITKNNELFCWAFHIRNVSENQMIDSFEPKLIESLNETVIDVCCGANHSLLLTQTGEVFTFGSYDAIQTLNNLDINSLTLSKVNGFDGEKVKAISSGSNHSLALTESGRAFSWGCNQFGQLGIESSSGLISFLKKKIKETNAPKLIKIDTNDKNSNTFERISCGSNHSLLLSCDGDIYGFGNNICGQLGIDNREDQNFPIKIIIPNSDKFIDIASHFNYDISVGLSINGSYYVWGKCGQTVLSPHTETYFNSFNSVFAHYFCITYKSLHLNESLDQNSLFNKSEQNGKYEQQFVEFGLISSGNFGIVCKAKNRKDEKIYAIKKIPLNETLFEKVFKELDLMLKLRSDYVVEYRTAWIENKSIRFSDYENISKNNQSLSSSHSFFDPNKPLLLHIEMELCSQTLRQLIEQMKNSLIDKNYRIISFYISCELMIETVEGVSYLHKNNVIHRDLKPTNILITDSSGDRSVKIADFGLSTIHEREEESHSELTGTLKYMAPEVLTRKYDTKADIYSLGVITQELFNFNAKK
jgi:alpha-tubulin suppressor-like RCC1 family protein/tRNA A-37 threonylcarbamoyl transferase component Bud32